VERHCSLGLRGVARSRVLRRARGDHAPIRVVSHAGAGTALRWRIRRSHRHVRRVGGRCTSTIAPTPRRTGSGRVGHAAISRRRSSSAGGFARERPWHEVGSRSRRCMSLTTRRLCRQVFAWHETWTRDLETRDLENTRPGEHETCTRPGHHSDSTAAKWSSTFGRCPRSVLCWQPTGLAVITSRLQTVVGTRSAGVASCLGASFSPSRSWTRPRREFLLGGSSGRKRSDCGLNERGPGGTIPPSRRRMGSTHDQI
jgi:hypothetical protein